MKKTVLVCDICKNEFTDNLIDEIKDVGIRRELKARHKLITPMGVKEVVIDEICTVCAKKIVAVVDKLWKEV